MSNNDNITRILNDLDKLYENMLYENDQLDLFFTILNICVRLQLNNVTDYFDGLLTIKDNNLFLQYCDIWKDNPDLKTAKFRLKEWLVLLESSSKITYYKAHDYINNLKNLSEFDMVLNKYSTILKFL